jgi:DNA-binding response OmpR family regulator
MKIEIELNEYAYQKLLKVSSYNKLTKEDYVKLIVNKNLENNIYLEQGYVYDLDKKVLMHENNLIYLNNLEEQLFEYLIKNIDRYVSSSEIIENVVKSKPMSIFAMRNQIKKIRDKTHKDLIMVKSNVGYMINSLSINKVK